MSTEDPRGLPDVTFNAEAVDLSLGGKVKRDATAEPHWMFCNYCYSARQHNSRHCRSDGACCESPEEAYARGISEGRRQATEGWDRLRWRLADGSTWEFPHESYVAAYAKAQRRMERQYGHEPGELQQRLVGPWEPAEQDEGGAR